MPKHPPSDAQGLSIRLPTELVTWLKEMADENREPVTMTVRRILDDYRSFFGLSGPFIEQLLLDMKAMGMKDARAYMQHMIANRVKDILAKGPGYEKKEGEKSGRR